ncbi:hypothetical protein [Scytonema sp. HK-05]|uniref:hypothetical protein n=1 Tax=Scytonema sp. HK-05 TaxID=1137095 RepID=UPI000935848E|nr:hypothetical protein [Scytonema sp. HK-05]OKH60123.1 hypothetical protein NIES2130_05025 [Scytonema sp. HK-05]
MPDNKDSLNDLPLDRFSQELQVEIETEWINREQNKNKINFIQEETLEDVLKVETSQKSCQSPNHDIYES